MDLIIKEGPKGRGVFANKVFESGEIIEICPVIASRIPEVTTDCWSNNYVYLFGDGYGFVLGYGSLYNHSYTPNAMYIRHPENNTMIYQSLTHINEGDEILINYNGDIYCKDPLWFDYID